MQLSRSTCGEEVSEKLLKASEFEVHSQSIEELTDNQTRLAAWQLILLAGGKQLDTPICAS